MSSLSSLHKSIIALAVFAPLAVALLFTAHADANTRLVPSQYPTIQAAIDASVNGDTIVVAAGTYCQALTWYSKDLTIQGAGEGRSIIDPSTANGGSGGRCLDTVNLTPASRLEGFTLQNGNVTNTYGAGMRNRNSNPTITHCTFKNNTADYGNSGMANRLNSSPTMTDCTFLQNGHLNISGANSDFGGDIANAGDDCTPTVTRCTFTKNQVASRRR